MDSMKYNFMLYKFLRPTWMLGLMLILNCDAVQWVTVPHQYTYGYMGLSAVIQWQYNLSSSETFDALEVQVIKNTYTKTIAKRSQPRAKFKFYDTPFTNRLNVTGVETISLIIYELLQENDNEQYCCKLSYEPSFTAKLKEIKECTTLITVDSPSISHYPQKVSTRRGDQVQLFCNATGKPSPNITWTKSSKPLDIISSSRQLIVMINGTEDDGEYTCNATNGFGNSSIAKFFIEVLYSPLVAHFSRNVTVIKGQKAKLFCNATGKPSPNITWTKSSKPLDIISSSRQLTVMINGSEDEGEYTCNATNGIGNHSIATFFIELKYQPLETKVSATTTAVIVNQTVVINCTADAAPPANFTFLKDGIDEYSSATGLLETSVMERVPSVTFTCIPWNKYGAGPRANITVTVNYSPLFTRTPGSKYDISESAVSLLCSATANPKPNITWVLAKNESIIVGRGEMLKVKNKCANRTLVYRCIASNSVGTVSSAEIFIEMKPSIRCNKLEKKGDEGNIQLLALIIIPLIGVLLVFGTMAFVFTRRRRNKSDMNIITGGVAHKPGYSQTNKDISPYPVKEESPYELPIDALPPMNEIALQEQAGHSTGPTVTVDSNYATVDETEDKKKVKRDKKCFKRTKKQNKGTKVASSEPVYEEISKHRPEVLMCDGNVAYAAVYQSNSPKKEKLGEALYTKVNKGDKTKNSIVNQDAVPLYEELPAQSASDVAPPLPLMHITGATSEELNDGRKSPAEHFDLEKKDVVSNSSHNYERDRVDEEN